MLTHQGTQPLRTQRLLLRRFCVADAQAMFDNWASDARVTRYLTWSPYTSVEQVTAFLTDCCAKYADDHRYMWAITLEDMPIGSINAEVNDAHDSAELGYCLGYEYWGQGIMTEAAGCVVDMLFESVGLHRVTLRHAAQNPASGRVAQKLGMQREGVAREAFKSRDGTYWDIVHYALLREAWAQRRRASV